MFNICMFCPPSGKYSLLLFEKNYLYQYCKIIEMLVSIYSLVVKTSFVSGQPVCVCVWCSAWYKYYLIWNENVACDGMITFLYVSHHNVRGQNRRYDCFIFINGNYRNYPLSITYESYPSDGNCLKTHQI